MDDQEQGKRIKLEKGQTASLAELDPAQLTSSIPIESDPAQIMSNSLVEIDAAKTASSSPAEPDKASATSLCPLELVLLRHGHTQWNKERRYLGSSDLPLLPEERDRLAAHRELSELTGDFWRVYCSDLLRCRETLAAAAPSLEARAVYDSRLREMSFGEWEGCNYEQLSDNPLYRSWIDDPAAVTPPGGEAWTAFAARLQQFLTDLLQEAGLSTICCPDPQREDGQTSSQAAVLQQNERQKLRVLIVTHGGVIRHLLAKTQPGVTFRTAIAPPPGTAAVIQLQ
ncbi:MULTISPECIES: histidine phosphatase family protein [unclassified Paenibacillus]|uniref:histidine phosphatase family protein n=1 Tax=unclassified Paenibacillus TaxID=185978 RepID=UPI002405A7E5|nr:MULTISPECIES: histidine phosphatase family protein [unclassified Paenibacillus]MDF9841974.1 alpha-ribazole phosphatase [Paenibacillus sp. PastF-2]MDF9848772.1 alpha-ribazole phosphatase [Paenibacillus sp. PastM-2]MDF9855342.1 alpha-ribazole phosphatase [Paenibacillus sp. PastF-1]MDH6480612.1 alpha-ribazole phosphatase [Paenibacillus sp. PastH-2]MDH6508037.1 alpha-ribazole phosphatase [Paenibacillus sp. PastM-3]